MEYKVGEKDVKTRLDSFLYELDNSFTRSHYKNLIEEGHVLVNSKKVKAGYALKLNDVVSVEMIPARPIETLPQNIPLDIVYEDEDLAVINKPKGMVVHPANGNWDGTLVNALLYNIKDLSGINGEIRPGIVHRLDKDTSGLLVVAKNDFAHVALSKQIADKTCKRIYLALVIGNMPNDSGVVANYLGRDPKNRLRYAVVDNGGKYAETHYKVLTRYKDYSLVEFELKTGRTHQIRVHCKYLNHPIVGDDLYGGKSKFKTDGQMLHAYKLSFYHPRTNKYMEFEAQLPEYFQKILSNLQII
ncbi:MAG: RluA family pseudouridine synthase [Eubacteriales bacterium]|nr:RluA family pseudouridine synthase [Eubacteriales bacterium]